MLPISKITKNQSKTFEIILKDDQVNSSLILKNAYALIVNIRYDDCYGNGHNSFSITGDLLTFGQWVNYQRRGYSDNSLVSGCIPETIGAIAPELSHLLKWSRMTSKGPIQYVSNTLYLASDRDHNGLRCGEYGHYTFEVLADITYGNELISVYKSGNVSRNRNKNPYVRKANSKELKALQAFTRSLTVPYKVIKKPCEWSLVTPDKANPSDLEGARRVAIWPEATLEQLQDKNRLLARLPSLVSAFKADIEKLGFIF